MSIRYVQKKICLQLILLSQGNFFLTIGSLEVMYEFIFTIPSVIQISSISSIWLRFNLGKPRMYSFQPSMRVSVTVNTCGQCEQTFGFLSYLSLQIYLNMNRVRQYVFGR